MKAINAIIALSLQKSKQALKGTGAKRDVRPDSSVSRPTRTKVPGCPGGVGAYGLLNSTIYPCVP